MRRFLTGIPPHLPAGWTWAVATALALVPGVAVATLIPLLIRRLVDDAMRRGDGALAARLLAGIAGLALLDALALAVGPYLAQRFASAVGNSIRTRLFAQLQRLSVDFFAGEHIGALAAKATVGVSSLEGALLGALPRSISQGAILVIGVCLLFAMQPLLAVICVLLLPLVALASRPFGPAYDQALDAKGGAAGRLIGHATESLAAHEMVRAYQLGDAHLARFRELAAKSAERNARAAILQGLIAGLTQGSGYLVVAVALLTASLQVLDHRLSVGSMLAFVQLAYGVVRSVESLTGVILPLKGAGASLQSVEQLLARRPAVADAPGARPLERLQRVIELDGVTYAYGGSRALDAVSLEVRRGSSVAIVGHSGSGKSTLLRLLLRLADPIEGSVRFDGVDLREVDSGSLRRQIGIVFQDTFIFEATIGQNIAAGRPDASAEEVALAAERADLADFVRALPDGLETKLREGGRNLSGGQRQRIGIARALLRDPALLILDEATSALDPDAEAAVAESIRRISAGRTTIAVTHRLSQTTGADTIFVLDGGRLVERGTHRTLLAAAGHYASLWERQNGFTIAAGHRGGHITPRRLRLVPLFSRLGEEDLADVARRFQIERVAAGQDVIREGDAGDRFYIVVRGIAEVHRDGEVLATLQDGDHFGELALINSAPRNASVSTVAASVFATLQRADFLELLDRDPELARMIAETARGRGASAELSTEEVALAGSGG